MFPQNLRRRFKILHILYLGWKMRQKRKRNIDLSSEYTGAAHTMELLTGNDRQCEELMRMPRETYIKLCQHFKEKNWLKDSRYISVEEKIAMFLNIVSHGKCVRLIKRRFQHSTQTVHHYFHEVLGAMIEFSKEVIVPTTYDPDPNIPGHHKRLRSIFKGAIGALDGTLVHAIVPIEKQTPYRGRGRDICFQNVLAICDFNMIFTFVFAGWEGVAHDSRILHEVAFDPIHCFPFPPPDKYYLCDAAYAHTRYFMTPYRNTRYWINDFRRGAQAQSKEEVFNQAHAKLRNVIERAFGVLKARYRILGRMLPYSLATQRDIVIACCALHNFLRREKVKDQLFTYFEDPNACISSSSQATMDIDEPTTSTVGESSRQGDQEFMTQLRNQLTNDLMKNRRAQTQRQHHT